MSDTPSWLTDENIAAAAKNPTVQKAAKAAAVTAVEEEKKKYNPPSSPHDGGDEESQDPWRKESTSEPEPVDVTPEELKQMQMWALILRVLYMCISICMAAAAFLVLEKAHISTVFIALYVFFFAILICCFELALTSVARWMAENFGFMYSLSGRLIFIVFVAVLCFDLMLFGKIVMALLLAATCVDIYVYVSFPKYEAWLRHKHYAMLTKGKN
mmetsp:Transcript_14317/g.21438  ORF Transcript_14317/g.21438 Transcript_14317/m.21438 type:complete len:214 (+) Transcript_14317:57-698(+)